MTEPAQSQEVATVSEGAVVLSMLERALFDNAVDLARVEKLMDMQERVMAKNAEAAYTAAMVEAQAKMDPIRADLVNTHANDSKYASYSALDRAIRPIYTEAGFFVDFNTENAENENEIIVLCYISHNEGHTRNYRITIPCDGKGAKGGEVMSRTHATVSAVSYGKRVLLGMGFNLAVDKDDDGNAADGPHPLTAAQAQEWIRHDHITDMIRTCPTFRRLKNMRNRIEGYRFFLPKQWADMFIEECDKREDDLDAALSTKAQQEAEPTISDEHRTRLDDFERECEGQTEEGISELKSEYMPFFDGAHDDVWKEFARIVEAAKQ